MIRTDFIYPKIFQGAYFEEEEDLSHLGDFLPPLDVLKDIIAVEKVEARNDASWKLARENFKNEDGSPWEMSPAELYLFRTISSRLYPRVQVTSSTQYGKTITVSRAVLQRIANYPEDWLICVPDMKRGKIFLDYMVKDTANNELFRQKLIGVDLGKKDALAHLLEERSKVKLTYQILDGNIRRYGSVEIITTEARRVQNTMSSVMGFGGRNVIAEESSLIDNEVEAGIFRMLAGKGADTFYCKIGNPFFRNHFYESWISERYQKIFVNDQIGLADGRYNFEFLQEAMDKPQAEILYQCKFPSETSQDKEGWTNLFTKAMVDNAMTDVWRPFGIGKGAADPADTGENEAVIIERWENVMRVAYADPDTDPTELCGPIADCIDKDEIDMRNFVYDRNGVGAGMGTTMKNMAKPIIGVHGGEKCLLEKDQEQFYNQRAQWAWELYKWVASGGKLLRNPRWYQLLNVKYKRDASRGGKGGKMRIMGKEEMRRYGIESPDVFDAASMTFARKTVLDRTKPEDRQFNQRMREKNKKRGSKGLSVRMA